MKPHKHTWRYISGSYSKETGLVRGKKKCITCGIKKEVMAIRNEK